MQGNANDKNEAMKFPARGAGSYGAQKGFALVLVLISLVLLSVMVVGYFSMAAGQKKSTAAFRHSNDVQELARLGVDAVIAQIRDATTQNGTSWASQPGAIRTYSANATYSALNASGSRPDTVYKLYSSANMTVSGNAFNASNEVPPQNWDAQPGIYVDLNAPAISSSTSGSQKLNFPIIDPRAFTTSNSTSVQGFSYNSSVNGTVLPSSGLGNDNQRLPMPARWLYVLQDGKMVNPTSQSGNVVTVPGASKTNPIVGRVAFWTDDETAKVNVNTAGGDIWNSANASYAGSYWSPPYAHSEFDQKKLAMAQPYQREYQRYPGHPGTVHISAVFPNLSLEEIMSLTPRYRFGGSKGGTIDLKTTGSAITPKSDRLYASVDELIYDPSRNESSTINADRLERARFFLTANSRASDLNLFGLPKVSAWPIHRRTSSQYRTPFDETIAFCSTVNGHEYFFTRNQANDPQGDFNTRNGQLYDYLGNLLGRKVPGFGGNGTLADKWTSPERWQILTQIYDYIRSTNLTDTSTSDIMPYAMNVPSRNFTPESPGFGQVVPTRITRNGVSTSGFGRYPVISELGFAIIEVPENAIPANANLPPLPANPGIRRFYQMIILVEMNSPSHGMCPLGYDFSLQFTGLDSFRLAPEVNTANQQDMLHVISPSGGVQSTNASGNLSVGFPSTATFVLQQYSGRGVSEPSRGFYPRGWGGVISPKSLLLSSSTDKDKVKSIGNEVSSEFFPLISNYFAFDFKYPPDPNPPNTLTLNTFFKMMEASIQVQQIGGNGGQHIIDYNFVFPKIGQTPGNNSNRIRAPSSDNRRTLKEMVEAESAIDFIINNRQMVIRTVQPNGSQAGFSADTRFLLVGPSSIPKSWFIENSNYLGGFNPAPETYCQHGFQCGDGITWGGWGNNFYFKVGEASGISRTSQPNISGRADPLVDIKNANGMPSDWDNGIGPFSDGAYINKPDDGATEFSSIPPTGADIYYEPYFRSYGGFESVGETFFSPNRILPSPVMFGSLPSGIKSGQPWQTLLFNPAPSAGVGHAGFSAGVPDHAILDLFSMPIVDPYAISEPASTAGRINLNQALLPYSYIGRDTALLAALRGLRVPVISGDSLGGFTSPETWRFSDPFQYKVSRASGGMGGGITYNSTSSYLYHRPIDLSTTIDGFRKRMASDNLFRSSTEICDMFLVPDLRASAGSHFLNSGLSNPAPNINTGIYDPISLRNFWTASGNGLKWSGLTGDNLRERPYALLYPLVTTKSNSYTVHVIAQTLQNSLQAADDQFIERDGAVTGEWQGSYLIERQLAQNDPGLIDYTQNPNPGPENHPEHLHKIRVLQTRRFNPGT